MRDPNEVLRKYWGHDRLRPAQEKAITSVLNGKDTIALLPTGGGKSICFQIPALLSHGICIVVSPLISLMQDQVQHLKEKGVKAMMLGGHLSFYELIHKLDQCQYGNYKFLYLSPERLQQEVVQDRIRDLNVNLIAIDEAHCISEWGHDFRPAYREIPVLKELQPHIPMIALTATATAPVLQDIQENLGLQEAELVKLSFERKNIALLIHKSQNKIHDLERFLKANPGVAIIYVRSRKLTLKLRSVLQKLDLPAEAYHGGMTAVKKKQLLDSWQEEEFEIMVATNAFGMGIDKNNVRNVIHYHLPDTLESYYQEIGRAGRDGKEAKALVLYDDDDIIRLKDQFLKNAPTPEKTKFIYKKLNNYFSVAYGEGQNTAHNFNFSDFCQTYALNPYLTYNVFQFLDRMSVISLSQEFHQRTEIYFRIPNRNLYSFIEENPRFRILIHALLRSQGGFFSYKTPIDLYLLQNKTGMSKHSLNGLLKKLQALEVIDLTLADQDSTIEFLVPREDNFTINPLVPFIEKYHRNKKEKIEKVIHYIKQEVQCKRTYLLAYFDEVKKEDCGKCSYCKHKAHAGSKKSASYFLEIRKQIYASLSQNEQDSQELASRLSFDEEDVLYVLQRMLDKEEVVRTPSNRYVPGTQLE